MKLITTQQAAEVLHMSRAAFLRTIVAAGLVRVFRRNSRVVLIHEDSLNDFINRRSK